MREVCNMPKNNAPTNQSVDNSFSRNEYILFSRRRAFFFSTCLKPNKWIIHDATMIIIYNNSNTRKWIIIIIRRKETMQLFMFIWCSSLVSRIFNFTALMQENNNKIKKENKLTHSIWMLGVMDVVCNFLGIERPNWIGGKWNLFRMFEWYMPKLMWCTLRQLCTNEWFQWNDRQCKSEGIAHTVFGLVTFEELGCRLFMCVLQRFEHILSPNEWWNKMSNCNEDNIRETGPTKYTYL